MKHPVTSCLWHTKLKKVIPNLPIHNKGLLFIIDIINETETYCKPSNQVSLQK
jgi:hypothetical protein